MIFIAPFFTVFQFNRLVSSRHLVSSIVSSLRFIIWHFHPDIIESNKLGSKDALDIFSLVDRSTREILQLNSSLSVLGRKRIELISDVLRWRNRTQHSTSSGGSEQTRHSASPGGPSIDDVPSGRHRARLHRRMKAQLVPSCSKPRRPQVSRFNPTFP